MMELKLDNNNFELINDFIKLIPEKVDKYRGREISLTSTDTARVSMEVYKQGFYLTFEGTRNRLTQWFTDNDGELIPERKPNKNKLDILYKTIPRTMYINKNSVEYTSNM